MSGDHELTTWIAVAVTDVEATAPGDPVSMSTFSPTRSADSVVGCSALTAVDDVSAMVAFVPPDVVIVSLEPEPDVTIPVVKVPFPAGLGPTAPAGGAPL